MSPGRFRRWIVRPAVWLLVGAVLAAAGLVLLIESDFLSARVRVLAEAQLEDLLSRPVRIGAIEVGLAPLSIEARDVVIAGLRPGDRDFAVVPRILIEADLSGLRRPSLRLRTVEAEAPQVFVERFPDGSDNVPRLRKGRPRGGEARIKVSIDSLVVRGGVFSFAERSLPFDLDATAVRADLVGLGGYRLSGQLVGQDVVVGLPNARPYPVSLAAKVTLDRGQFLVESARLAGPDVLARGRGEVTWGARRAAHFDVEGDVRSQLLVRLGYVTDQVQGEASFAGAFDWTKEAWGYRADVTAPALRLLERDLTAVRGVVEGAAKRVHFRLDEGTYRGGRVTGDLEVDLSTRARPTRVDLRIDGADAAGALADQAIPVDAVAGTASGTVSYRFDFSAPQTGSGEIAIRVAPRDEPGRLAISGTVPLSLDRGVLRIESLRIDAPGQWLTMAGSYDMVKRGGRFDWTLETEDPGRLALLLPPVEGPRLWWPTAGAGTVSGTLEVGASGTEAAIEVALENVRSPGASADLLVGSLRVGERAVEGLDLRLRRGPSELVVRGDVPLGSGAAAAGLSIQVDGRDWQLGDVRAWLPEEVAALGLDGLFTGSLALSGSTEAPAGRVQGDLRQASLGAVELGDLRAAFSFDAAAIDVASAQLSMPAGDVLAKGRIGLAGGPLSIDLEAPGLRLDAAPLGDLFGGELGGEAAVEARLEGTLERPRGRARVTQRGLTLAGKPLQPGEGGDAELRLEWDGRQAELDGSLFGLVAVDGGGTLDLEHVGLRVVVASEHLPVLADLVVEAELPEFTGAFVGEVAIAGRFDQRVGVSLALERLELGFRGHTLRNLEPARARLDGDGIVIDSLYLGEAEGEIFLAGRLGFSEQRPLDLKLQASLPAPWLELIAPTVRATGYFDALATIRGTAERPEVNGEGGLRDTRMILLGFPHAFEDVRAVLLFYPRAVVLDTLSSRLGGGLLQATGRVELPVGAPLSYRFQATARDVALRYPEGWLVRGGGDLTLASTEGGRQVSGALTLDRAYYLRDVQVGLAQLLRSLLARQRVQVAETDEVLSTTALNVALRIPRTLRVRNNIANLRGEADLALRGSLARPIVFGRVEMERGGTVVYAENEYKVERAILSFANPYRIEPIVDLVATTEVSSYQVTLNLSGPLERLRATFAADPPIPDLEVLSLLATGEPGTLAKDLAPDASAGSSQGAEAFLAGQAANLIGQRVGTLFGLDKFRVAPLAAGGDAVSSVRLTVGKRLRRNLLLTYSVDPSATQDQFLTVEWRLGSSLALVFTQNGDGSYAVDAKWEKAF